MKLKLILVGLIALLMMVVPAMAVTGCELTLVQKNSDWDPIDSGIYGTLHYNYDVNNFTFTGNNLPAGDYTLINYMGVWNGNQIIIGNGDGSGFTGTLPATLVPSTENPLQAKLWLVPTSSIDGNGVLTWNPELYLFESNLVPLDTTVCAGDSGSVDIIGEVPSASYSLAVTDPPEFGTFKGGDNIYDPAGTLTVTAHWTGWDVTVSYVSGNGYMMNAGSEKLANPLKQLSTDRSEWTNVNAFHAHGDKAAYMDSTPGTTDIPLAYLQTIDAEDPSGEMSISILYTITAA